MKTSTKRNTGRVLAVSAATVAFTAGSIGGAFAEALDEQQNGGRVTGSFGTANNTTTWNITITDTAADGDCVYAEVQVDRNLSTDPEFPGPKACGKGNKASYSGSRFYSDASGSRVKICNTAGVPDKCITVNTNADN